MSNLKNVRLYHIRHAESMENFLRNMVVMAGGVVPIEASILMPKMLGEQWSLTPKGINQAESLKALNLFPETVAVFSSPFERAHRTAKIVFPNQNLCLDDRLIERSTGKDHDIVTLPADSSFGNMWEWKPEEGESLKNVAEKRLKPFLEHLDSSGLNDIVLVSHNSIVRTLHAMITGHTSNESFEANLSPKKFKVPNCGVIVYEGVRFSQLCFKENLNT